MLLHLALSCAIVRPTPPPQRPTAVSLDRRTAVRTFGSLAALPLLTASAVAAKDKGYLTLSEYQALKQQEKAEEKLYGQFEALRLRASQTKEFDALAAKDDFTGISKLALAWDSSIRKDLLEQASSALVGQAKEDGGRINKEVLNDLKALDKLAKAAKKDDVPEASAKLRDDLLAFVALTPQKLTDKFGVSDL
ncbi:hypothetical protein AB1Y20_003363 [Prymnesium parvum]|uniref:Uncharacterized protein n=1 Tax=Prymnesium parvum TaxID=97485 RepID=A0AB34JEC5_PRYPA